MNKAMDFKTSLDRYLTTPPDDGFDGWSETVWNKIPVEVVSNDEYDKYEGRLIKAEELLFRRWRWTDYFCSLDEVARILGMYARMMIDTGKWK